MSSFFLIRRQKWCNDAQDATVSWVDRFFDLSVMMSMRAGSSFLGCLFVLPIGVVAYILMALRGWILPSAVVIVDGGGIGSVVEAATVLDKSVKGKRL